MHSPKEQLITSRHRPFFPNTKLRALENFFTGHKIIPTFPNYTLQLHIYPLSFSYNYSISSNNTTTLSNVTPCSVAACKSISNTPTDNKVYQVLFDSGSSKTLIHKQIVLRTLHLFPPVMNYRSFCLLVQPHPWLLWL